MQCNKYSTMRSTAMQCNGNAEQRKAIQCTALLRCNARVVRYCSHLRVLLHLAQRRAIAYAVRAHDDRAQLAVAREPLRRGAPTNKTARARARARATDPSERRTRRRGHAERARRRDDEGARTRRARRERAKLVRELDDGEPDDTGRRTRRRGGWRRGDRHLIITHHHSNATPQPPRRRPQRHTSHAHAVAAAAAAAECSAATQKERSVGTDDTPTGTDATQKHRRRAGRSDQLEPTTLRPEPTTTYRSRGPPRDDDLCPRHVRRSRTAAAAAHPHHHIALAGQQQQHTLPPSLLHTRRRPHFTCSASPSTR